MKNGNGVLYFSNGDNRVGVWKDDKLHGQATYYYSGGRIDEEVKLLFQCHHLFLSIMVYELSNKFLISFFVLRMG